MFYRWFIGAKSLVGGPTYNCLGRPIGGAGSSMISSQCDTQPLVLAMANMTVNMFTGILSAL